MTKSILALALLTCFTGFSQILTKEAPITLSKMSNIGSVYITSDGLSVFSDAEYDYQFDDQGNLVNQIRVKFTKTKGTADNHALRLNELYKGKCFDKETDTKYEIQIGKRPFLETESNFVTKTKYDPKIGLVTEKVYFEDDLQPEINLIGTYKGDKTPYSEITCFDEDGNIVGLALYMSISNTSHPNLKNLEKNKFHTFVHIVKLDPKTNNTKIHNLLIDKIDLPRTDKNFAFGELVGVVKNKVIVKYTTSRNDNGPKDSDGNSSKRKFTYWSIDLTTLEERQLFEYETNIPNSVENFKFFDEIVDESVITDCSWTEKNENGEGFVSSHKLLVMNDNFEFHEEEFIIPSELLTLKYSAPVVGEFLYDKNGKVMMCNLVSSQVNGLVYINYLFLYKKNKFDEIELVKNEIPGIITSLDGNKLMVIDDSQKLDFDQVYGQVRAEKVNYEDCSTCLFITLTAVRLVDEKVQVFSIDYITRGKSKILEKFPPVLRIVKFPLSY